MEKNRVILFQALLVILAFVFICAVRYLAESRTAEAGSFGAGEYSDNVTVADVFAASELWGQVR